MPQVDIASLWTPAVWIDEMREKQATFPSAINSGVGVRTPEFDAKAEGEGLSVNIPVLKDITDQADEIQVEDTAPTTTNGIGSGLCVAPLCNRVTKNAATALSAQVSGADPVGHIVGQLLARRLKQRDKTLISILRGGFNGAGALNAAAPLSACRLESFRETGASPIAANTMSVTNFINGKKLLGELEDDLLGGCIIMHPDVKASLEIADAISFKEASMGAFKIKTYRGIPLFLNSTLVRAGSVSGYVYETYLCASGIVAMGEKAQKGDVIDVASLQYDANKDKNNALIYDRTRFLMGLNGMKWIGTPAGQSPTNAELATAANWTLQLQSANRVGAVLIRTNA